MSETPKEIFTKPSDTPIRSSRLKGFFKLDRGERIDALRAFTDLPVDQTRILGQDGSLSFDLADLFIENAIGSYPLPLGIATNFKVNGRDFVLPMAVEESSVVAAASNAARWIYDSGGFEALCVDNLMIGQIQILDLPSEEFDHAELEILRHQKQLLELANQTHPRLVMRGGGARSLEVRKFPNAEIPFMVVHVLVDTRDAMGANLINTICEKLAPEIAILSGGRVGLRILSNLADRKIFKARVRVLPEVLQVKELTDEITGLEVARRIHEAAIFAWEDPYRATTHNKGIMNGVDPVAIATGNDWRAIESGCHAYAARTGQYRALSRWRMSSDKKRLEGELEIPLQLGTVGGVTRLHPLAQLGLRILGNPSSIELGCLMACAGLASNLAALRALVTTGIQRGHMKLHAKNLSLAAGARGNEVEVVANQMVIEKRVSASAAEKILSSIRAQTISEVVSLGPNLRRGEAS
jgi:hydroxymethylglutaryl-CoA reductase